MVLSTIAGVIVIDTSSDLSLATLAHVGSKLFHQNDGIVLPDNRPQEKSFAAFCTFMGLVRPTTSECLNPYNHILVHRTHLNSRLTSVIARATNEKRTLAL
jgi:hypothetical protein